VATETAQERARALRTRLDAATARLAAAGVPSPQADAAALAAYALGTEGLDVLQPPELDPGFEQRYQELIDRRSRREPLQLITGRATFRYLDLRVRPGVFLPRPETEWVTEQAITALRTAASSRPAPVVLDLCSGTGAIALSIAHEVPEAQVLAVEVSEAAVATIEGNAGRHHIELQVLHGDVREEELLRPWQAGADVVISNPPYIPPGGIPVDPEVREYDPAPALYGGGADGLEVPRAVVAGAARTLRPGGTFVMEHGADQGEQVREVVRACGAFTDIETRQDLTGRDRMVVACRIGPTTS